MNWLRRTVQLSALALLATFAACDGVETPTQVPSQPQEFLGLGGLLGGGSSSDYTLVRDPLLSDLLSLKVSALVDVTGGTLELLGHTLTVPAGAVDRPTIFTLLVLPTGYVEVDLTANLTGLLGGLLNVGGNGFDKPIPITLSYDRATNVSDPSKLTVVYLPGLLGYRRIEPVPSTVDQATETVHADLQHFSRYALAFPRSRR